MNKKTHLRLLSDLHLEFSEGQMHVPELPTDAETVMVLAGDVGLASKSGTYIKFLEKMSEQFQDVIYIMGNHEHYKGSIDRSMIKILREIQYVGGMHNIHVANNRTVRINDVSFVCSTMWSSFDRGNPMSQLVAESKMNDYKVIRTGKGNPYQRPLRTDDTYHIFLESINYIFSAIKAEKQLGQKVVVVTHHAPSYQSISEKYRTDDCNGAYASDLDYDILEAQPDMWFHGHSHVSMDYMIGDTRVVNNPRGYWSSSENDLNPEFNNKLILTV